MRLREFKERQRLDEVGPAAVPLWFALVGLLGAGAGGTWSSMSSKQKKDSATWFKNNIGKPEYKDTVKKIVPYLAPGYGIANIPSNNNVGVEKLAPIVNNPESFNLGINAKPLTQPGDINKGKTNKNISNTQPTPLVQPDGSTGSAPSVLDNITSWFKDTFSSDTDKTAPLSTVNKTVLAPLIKNKTRKVNPAYEVPKTGAVTDNGDGTVTWNGQEYDKVFDKTKIAQINQSIIDNQRRRQQGQISKSVGGGSAGAVSGPKDKGASGGALGGSIGDIPWDGGVSGGKTGVGGQAKPTIGDVSQGSTISKGTTGVQDIPKGTAVPISKVQVTPLAKVAPNTIARTGTMPPGTMPPPIAQLPNTDIKKGYITKDYKQGDDIIYTGPKGRAPSKVIYPQVPDHKKGSYWRNKAK